GEAQVRAYVSIQSVTATTFVGNKDPEDIMVRLCICFVNSGNSPALSPEVTVGLMNFPRQTYAIADIQANGTFDHNVDFFFRAEQLGSIYEQPVSQTTTISYECADVFSKQNVKNIVGSDEWQGRIKRDNREVAEFKRIEVQVVHISSGISVLEKNDAQS
ncbi:MAG: hypothetical protein RLN85_18110, partial [Pseudomonadales bacterium]